MKILQINTRYLGGGGAATIANTLHKQLNLTNGFQSFYAYGRGVDGDSQSIRICNNKEAYISALSMRFLGTEFNKPIDKKLINEIKKADIIHLHNIHGYYVNYTELIELIVKERKKVIWTFHDVWPITGRCGFNFGCNRWKYGCGNCKNKNVYPTTFIDKSEVMWRKKKDVFTKLNNKLITIVTPSQWLANMVKESFLKNYNVKVINNGVPESSVSNATIEGIRGSLGLPIDKKIILFVAADPNDSRKGIKYILDTINRTGDDTIFVSVGKELKSFKSTKLIQCGYIKDKKKLDMIYAASDVFIIPSLDDNFPTTVLEAFRNSTPVIGFNVGGIPEQIENMKNGILVQSGSVDGLTNAIKEITKDEKTLNRFRENALKTFNENFSINQFINNYIDLYSK